MHPGAAARGLYSAAALQQAEVSPTDSVIVESPLPGGVAQVVRFLLNNVPPWVQISGAVLAVLAGAFLLWFLLRRRQAIRAWVVSKPRGGQLAIAAAALAMIVAVGTMSAATWNYTQHSNDFCTGCHVMNPAFQRFSAEENKHAELSCHDCHTQPLTASIRQLYLWVAERPAEIGEHAKVPNQVCETCHVTGDTATWQHVAATAGHRVHLESDSSALRDVQCVTCHGVEVHRFHPVAETCGQSECHKAADTDIVLGKMAEQTVRHCTSCHEFTADVPALATTDSARGTLVPGRPQCLGCHEMRRILADFVPERDPHSGKCGMCHNPHEQETPREAANTCATEGCHSTWEEEPFHVNAAHRRVGSQCLTCHIPHAAKVDASSCEDCHRSVRARSRRRPPLPFDTAAALRRSSAPVSPRPHVSSNPANFRAHSVVAAAPRPHLSLASETPQRFSKTDPPWPREVSRFLAGRSAVSPSFLINGPVLPADTFSHARHERLACIVCHATGAGHGRLTFEPPRGCYICHHQAPASARCASCHRRQEYTAPQPVTVTVQVADRQPRPRPVNFLHSPHLSRACVECHTTPVTLAPAADKAQCRDCHEDHHAAGRTCASCHASVQPGPSHETLEIAHQRCDACHTPTTVARLTPTRSFCSTCHTDKAADHYVQKECSVCHFLAEPGAYRSRLVTPSSE
jgi:nitrate/TMAO reductase-like tetraheme cytochrome c subunit